MDATRRVLLVTGEHDPVAHGMMVDSLAQAGYRLAADVVVVEKRERKRPRVPVVPLNALVVLDVRWMNHGLFALLKAAAKDAGGALVCVRGGAGIGPRVAALDRTR